MLTPDLILTCVSWYAVLVFSMCLHEAAHAWASWRLGDPTAYLGGQVTLNPIPHVQREPVGMVVIPLLSFFLNQGSWMIGWASAPYDPRWAYQYPRRSALMALAGPAANLALVIVSGVLLRIGLQMGAFELPPPFSFAIDRIVVAPGGGAAAGMAVVLSIFFMLNFILLIFNLLPVPPLDGAGAIPLILPDRFATRYLAFVQQPGLWMIGIFVAWSLFPRVFSPLVGRLLGLLYAGL